MGLGRVWVGYYNREVFSIGLYRERFIFFCLSSLRVSSLGCYGGFSVGYLVFFFSLFFTFEGVGLGYGK